MSLSNQKNNPIPKEPPCQEAEAFGEDTLPSPTRHGVDGAARRKVARTISRYLWSLVRMLYAMLPLSTLRICVLSSRKTPSLVRNLLHTSSDTSLMDLVSGRFLLYSFRRAARRVPAYREFLAAQGLNLEEIRTLRDFDERVPGTNRENYILAYSIRERCMDGRLPKAGTIDESAGSTGEPLNWVRSFREVSLLEGTSRAAVELFLECGGEKPSVVLNTFSCGAWAAGFRFGSALEEKYLVKNIGPDSERVYRTLKFFGEREHYLIAGYPPFLKEMVRFMKDQPDFNLKAFRIDIMTGGEGFPEGWRRFMETELADGARILSAYGASDLEVGIGTETSYSVAILRALACSETLRETLLGDRREPVFFGQYNPTGHYLRTITNEQGQRELETTVLNPYAVSPRIKYRIGDEGGVLAYETVRRFVQTHGIPCSAESMALPFLFLFGRADGTVSIDGANIYPNSVHSALLDHPLAARQIVTFKMGVTHPESGPIRLAILLQAAKGIMPSETLTRVCKEAIIHKLLVLNTDFRQSYQDNPASADPRVEVVPYESDLFKDPAQRVKLSYFL